MSAPLPRTRSTFAVVMSRTVVAHAVLASAALATAYVAWTAGDRADRPRQQRVTVLACAPADVRSVAFLSKRRTVRVDWSRDGGTRAAWITVTGEQPAHGAAPEPKRFAANEALDRWLAEHLPLRAVRSLGELDGARLAELDLVDTETRLDVDCGGRRASFRLGGSTYGTGDRYARLFAGGPVYLFAAAFASELEAAEARFMQRELHRFTAADVDEVRVEIEGRTRTLLHRNRRSADRATWVDQAEPDRRNELYGNWLDRVAALRVTEFLPSGREPDGLITPITTLRYAADGQETGSLVLVRSDGAGAPTYHARSEVTHGWVRVIDSIATQVEQDARSVVGLEPLTPAPTSVPIPAPPDGAR